MTEWTHRASDYSWHATDICGTRICVGRTALAGSLGREPFWAISWSNLSDGSLNIGSRIFADEEDAKRHVEQTIIVGEPVP